MSGVKTSRHISNCDQYVSFCTGCSTCEIVCGLFHEGYTSPRARRIVLDRNDITCRHTLYTCQNCVDPACYEACPLQDEALCYDDALGVAYVDQEACTGCGICAEACVFEPSRIMFNLEGKAVKCDLCREREEGPACIEYCQPMVLGFNGEQVPTAEEGVLYYE